MKKTLAFLLACVLCCFALLTGCVDIWQGVEGDERVYELDAYAFPYEFDHIKVKKDNTVEIYGDVDGDWQEVSFYGDEQYSAYKAEYNYRYVAYGTYKQIGDRLKIKFDYFLIMEVRGDDAEAYKSAYIKNNPDDAEIFGKGVNRFDGYKSANLVVSAKNNECKALEYKWKMIDDHYRNMTWSYYDSGEIKSLKYTWTTPNQRLDGVDTLKQITKFDIDGSFKCSYYAEGVIYSYEEYDSKGLINKKYGYDLDGNQDETTLYEYDSNGNLTTEKEYDSNDKLVSRKEREYDQNGKFTAEREYDSDDRLVSEKIQYDSMTTEYDFDGKPKVVKVYDSNGESMLRLEYIYDSNGRITLKREYNSNNELVNEIRYDD